MGSKGSKPRKPQHSQHLPKVGSPEENAYEQKMARHAVAENMSLGGRSDTSKTNVVVGVVAGILVIGAIGGLLLLTVFR